MVFKIYLIKINYYECEVIGLSFPSKGRCPPFKPKGRANCIIIKSYVQILRIKGDYPRTRASDSKHLPALNHFLVNILGLCSIFGLSTK